jgi:hypothetical protein
VLFGLLPCKFAAVQLAHSFTVTPKVGALSFLNWSGCVCATPCGDTAFQTLQRWHQQACAVHAQWHSGGWVCEGHTGLWQRPAQDGLVVCFSGRGCFSRWVLKMHMHFTALLARTGTRMGAATCLPYACVGGRAACWQNAMM